jgi:sulfur-oxidizing protein SoxX
MRWSGGRRWLGCIAVAVVGAGCAATQQANAPYRIEGDAIRGRLAPPGDPVRGRELALGRDANCLLCHAVPDSGGRPMGNIGPPLAGVGSRLNEGQLRLRIADSTKLNRETIMPSYYRTDGLVRVAETWRGKPILTAQQVEDMVAYLLALR